MSHLVRIETQFKDPFMLAAAAQALSLYTKLSVGGVARYYEGTSEECDYVIKLPGRYDIGFKWNETRSFLRIIADEELLGGKYQTDGYGKNDEGRLLLGEEACRLKQEYAIAVLATQAHRMGMKLLRNKLPSGEIKVTMTR